MEFVPKVATPEEAEQQSADAAVLCAADARWARLAEQPFSFYIPVEVEDEAIWIRIITQEEIIGLAGDLGRNSEGVLTGKPIRNSDVQKLILLRIACADDEGLPYYTIDALNRDFNEPQQTSFLNELFDHCVMNNPDIFTTVKKNIAP